MFERSRLTMGNAFGWLCVAGAAYGAFFFAPPYYARYRMDKIVIKTLEYWKVNEGEYGAKDNLAARIENARLPEYLRGEVCRVRTAGLEKHIDCKWSVEVVDPLFKHTELEFQIHKYLDPNGFLDDSE